MIGPELHPAVERLLAGAGLGPATGFTRLDGGGNNRVFRADAEGGRAALKVYFHHPKDTRDRLNSEFAFTSLAWDGGLRCLPKPLGVDRERRVALYEFLSGRKLDPAEIDGTTVSAATAFVAALNQPAVRAMAAGLPVASEACFSLSAHLDTVHRRLRRLAGLEGGCALDREAAAFIAGDVLSLWREIEQAAIAGAGRLGTTADAEISQEERCVSPSDFGFHNAIRSEDGRIRFIDFEYAGWDDPAKLVGDFFNQVAVPVPRAHFSEFCGAVARLFPAPERNQARYALLLPVYGMKWVAIVLNDFLPDGGSRRSFAGDPAAAEERKASQLIKARHALARLRTEIEAGARAEIGANT